MSLSSCSLNKSLFQKACICSTLAIMAKCVRSEIRYLFQVIIALLRFWPGATAILASRHEGGVS